MLKTFRFSYYNAKNEQALSDFSADAIAAVDLPEIRDGRLYFRVNYTGGGFIDIYDYKPQQKNTGGAYDPDHFQKSQDSISNMREYFVKKWNEC